MRARTEEGGGLLHRPILQALIVAALPALLYANSLSNGYSIDDHLIVDNHPLTAQGFGAIPEILTTNYLWHGDKGASYRAVPRVSYAVEYALFGPNPAVSHALNLLLYCLSGVVVWALLRALFPRADQWIPFVAALLFVAHPIHTEVVDNLKSRDELMATLLGLLSILAFFRYYRADSAAFLGLGGALFLLSLCSKESGHHFAGVIPLSLYFGAGWRARRMGAVLGIVALMTLAFWAFSLAVLDPRFAIWIATAKAEFPYAEHPLLFEDSLSIRYGTALYSIGYNVRLLVWPNPLSFFYGYGAIPLVGLTNPWALLSLGLSLGAAGVALAGLSRRTVPAFALLWFGMTIAMFSNLLMPVSGIVGERYLYAASLGFCVFVAWAITELARTGSLGRRVAVTVSIVILGAYGLATVDRNPAWSSRRSLAERDVRAFPEAVVIHAMLFQLYFDEAKATARGEARVSAVDRASQALSEMERIYPAYEVRAEYTKGLMALHLLDAPSTAIVHFERALSLSGPKDIPFHDPGVEVDPARVHLGLAEANAALAREPTARAELARAVEAVRLRTSQTPTSVWEWEPDDDAPLSASIERVRGLLEAAQQ